MLDEIDQNKVDKARFVELDCPTVFASENNLVHRMLCLPIRHITGPICNWVVEYKPDGRVFLYTGISLINGEITNDIFVRAVIDKLEHNQHIDYVDVFHLADAQGNSDLKSLNIIKRMVVNSGVYSPTSTTYMAPQ